MKEFIVNDKKFRIKKMNAIEVLALRSTLDFKSSKKALESYNEILERIEYNIKNDDWIQTYKDDCYYPAGLDEDFDTVQKLITEFLTYIQSVFTKSGESN